MNTNFLVWVYGENKWVHLPTGQTSGVDCQFSNGDIMSYYEDNSDYISYYRVVNVTYDFVKRTNGQNFNINRVDGVWLMQPFRRTVHLRFIGGEGREYAERAKADAQYIEQFGDNLTFSPVSGVSEEFLSGL